MGCPLDLSICSINESVTQWIGLREIVQNTPPYFMHGKIHGFLFSLEQIHRMTRICHWVHVRTPSLSRDLRGSTVCRARILELKASSRLGGCCEGRRLCCTWDAHMAQDGTDVTSEGELHALSYDWDGLYKPFMVIWGLVFGGLPH